MRYLLLIICIIFLSSILHADSLRIAVIDLEARGIDENTSSGVSDLVRGELINYEQLIVVERGQMTAILEEQGFQQSGCTEVECAIEVGQLLSAHYIIVGSVTKFGETYTISVRMVDVQQGIGVCSESIDARGEDNLPSATRTLVSRLVGKMEFETEEVEEAEQITRERPDKSDWVTTYPLRKVSYIGLGLSALGGGFGLIQNFVVAKKVNEINNLSSAYQENPTGAGWDDYMNKRNEFDGATQLRNVGYYVGGGLLFVSAVMFFIPKKVPLVQGGFRGFLPQGSAHAVRRRRAFGGFCYCNIMLAPTTSGIACGELGLRADILIRF